MPVSKKHMEYVAEMIGKGFDLEELQPGQTGRIVIEYFDEFFRHFSPRFDSDRFESRIMQYATGKRNPRRNSPMMEQEAKQLGHDHGYELGYWNASEMGGSISEDEAFEILAEADEHSRQFSPFEFIAHHLNESEYPDEVWAAFDEGVANGFFAALADAGVKVK